MRRAAATIVVVAAVLSAGSVAPAGEPGVVISISHGLPAADTETPEVPLGLRPWDVEFTIKVKVSGDPPCDALRVSADSRLLLNRRAIRTETYRGTILDESGRTTIDGVANPGEAIEVTAWAVCHDGNALRPVSKRARDVLRMPLHSCEMGMWKVIAVRARAELQDFEAMPKIRWLRLRKGDALPGAEALRTGRGAKLVFGNPACNGLRVSLYSHSFGDVGRYARTGKGEVTSVWGHARVTLDRHALGVSTDPLFLQPLGDRAASFELWTSRQRVRIDLRRGNLRVRPSLKRVGTFLRAGDRMTARCTVTRCRVER